MSTTLIDTIEVKNISPQIVQIYVQPVPNSPIFPKSGNIQLKSQASLEAEERRFDRSQLRQLRLNKLIDTNTFKRLVSSPSGGSGSIG